MADLVDAEVVVDADETAVSGPQADETAEPVLPDPETATLGWCGTCGQPEPDHLADCDERAF